MEMLIEYRYVIVAVVALIVWAIFNWEKVKKKVESAILKGEKWAKDEAKKGIEHSGQEVEDWIIENLYSLIVGRWRVIINEKMARKIIRFIYRKLIDALDDGKINDSV